MATDDRSRNIFDPEKHYTGVHMQQGRVLTDDDWNEAEGIHREERRRTRIDTIGPYGSPDEGFRVKPRSKDDDQIRIPIPGFFWIGEDWVWEERRNRDRKIDFTIRPGTFYVGGLRLVREKEETFLNQKDWQWRPDEETPQRPGDDEARADLVYVEAWQQPVSAVEDQELFEKALGGPDTTTRLRTMARVHVEPDVETEDCAAAWEKAKQWWKERGLGTLNAEYELESDSRLKVDFVTDGAGDNLCKPSVEGGYLGAENQAIRVELVDAQHFTWGFDNGAPLYRVEISDGNTVNMLSEPKDQAHWPVQNQVVEILPRVAKLVNGEWLAEELEPGHLTKARSSYDPGSGEFKLESPLPEEMKGQDFYFLRIWNRGSDLESQPEIELNPETPLGNTGLNITITGDRRPGDYWILAARPATPDKVVPWEFLEGNGNSQGRRPHGVRRFRAPLALIHWRPDADPTVEDCRKTFRPLTEIQTCCRFTVGDGTHSHGEVDSIKAALDHLPPGGGEICLLPGVHETNARIEKKRNITVKGCDKHTRVIPSNRDEPIFQVLDSQCITLAHMDLTTFGSTAIVLEGSKVGPLKEIVVVHNRILAYQQGIQVVNGVDIHIQHNRIRMLDKQNAGVGLFMLAEDSLIERNDVGVVPAGQVPPFEIPGGTNVPDPADFCTDRADLEGIYGNVTLLGAYFDKIFDVRLVEPPTEAFHALGGVQIAAESERIKVLENTIKGGSGNGITLGSALPERVGTDEESDEIEPRTIEHPDGGSIEGRVLEEGNGVEGVSLKFTKGDASLVKTSERTGYFKTEQVEQGEYTVSILSPGYMIHEIKSRTRTRVRTYHVHGFDPSVYYFYEITVAAEETERDVSEALYEIQIDRNDIASMGLSGIGIPHVPSIDENQKPTGLINRFGQIVTFLGIHRNHIHHCLQNPFQGDLRNRAREMGFGGISLGFCDDVMIDGNRIEHNGISHLHPTCGIFIKLGDKVGIHHNLISDNGPITPSSDPEARGIRGGVVVYSAAGRSPEEGGFGTSHPDQIHDNVVDHPVGPALALILLGSLSVCNNRFSSQMPAREYPQFGKVTLAGSVFIMKMGKPSQSRSLFHSNQSSLGPTERSVLASQIIWTTSDLGFDGNQSEAMAPVVQFPYAGDLERPFFINTFLIARTLRATNTRFLERSPEDGRPALISLLSQAFWNITTNNQGNHCIFAFVPELNSIYYKIIDSPNQEGAPQNLCLEVKSNFESWSKELMVFLNFEVDDASG